MADSHIALPGSDRPMTPGAQRIRAVDPNTTIELTITLRGPRLPDPGTTDQAPLSREAYTEQFSASQEDADKVSDVLRSYGLSVDETSLVTRSLHVRGTAAQIEAAFQVQLGIYHDAEQGDFRDRANVIRIPSQLDGLITGVFGLDERRAATPRGAGQ